MAARKRVLWVTAEPPDFNFGGGGIRQANLIRAVARHADVDLVLAGELVDDDVRVLFDRIVEVPAPKPKRVSRSRRRLQNVWHLAVSRDPEEARVNAARRRHLRAAVGEGEGYDIVNIEHLGLAALLPPRHQNRWAITLQFVSSEWAAQVGALAPHHRQALWWRQEQKKSEALERWVLKSFDVVVVPSPEDASHLPGVTHVIPNGVDTDLISPAPLPPAPRLVFTGTLSYLPNVDGLVWFCAEVLPRVQEAVPATTLTIVGRSAVEDVRRLVGRSGVTLVENAPSVVTHLHAARIAIVPLRVGTGTRLKALEAMAAGRPVVGTSIGLEGLGIVNGEEAAIADDPEGLATCIIELLADDARASALAANGRSLVERRFSWRQIGESYAELLLADSSESTS
jgi:glycosyltransferase involved in cell wall biosynthesis